MNSSKIIKLLTIFEDFLLIVKKYIIKNRFLPNPQSPLNDSFLKHYI
jgi:hypothetical protein